MSTTGVCPLCGESPASIQHVPNRDMFVVDCARCGEYRFTGSVQQYLREGLSLDQRRILRGQTRQSTRRGVVLELFSNTIDEIIKSAVLPQSPLEVADRILLDFSREARPFSVVVKFEAVRYLDYFLPSVQDMYQILRSLAGRGLLEAESQFAHSWNGTMTLAGWEHLRSIEHTIVPSWRAFVAMAFASELAPAWEDGIRPALEEAGYVPVRVDKVQFLGKIDDRIIAELRLADIVVADFTQHRGGVYFEAGFALGRGIPVIWCCQDADIKGSHFDTRQYNHIAWKTPAELKEQLVARLVATVPTRRRVPDGQ